MCFIQIDMHGLDRFFEVLLDDLETVELIVEDLVGRVLVDLLGSVYVDRVLVRIPPDPQARQQLCSVRIEISSPDSDFLLHLPNRESMELAIEDIVSCVLLELFGMVIVDRVTIHLLLPTAETALPY